MTSPPAVGVTVPATSANLGPGFDALGLALGLYDEVQAHALDRPGVSVEVEGEGAGTLPGDESHLVVHAMRVTFARLGVPVPGLGLRCRNRIPHGRGLGSSAAAIVAGVLAARGLADAAGRMDDAAVLELAAELEGHPDNVAACLLGGLTIAWRDGGDARAVRLEPSPGLGACLFIPVGALSTQAARSLLPETVPHADAAHAVGRAALLVEALTRRPDLLLAATDDRLHQPYRATAMPATADLVRTLRHQGVPATVSGAGPSVLALTTPATATIDPEAVAGQGWRVQRTALDTRGARAVSVLGESEPN